MGSPSVNFGDLGFSLDHSGNCWDGISIFKYFKITDFFNFY
jgi:hypothetical protein